MSKFLHAEYLQPEDVAGAIDALVAIGIPKQAMEMYSRQPVELHPPPLARSSHMSLAAVVTAIAAGSGVTAFVFWTQLDYPLVTGGMPLNSGWATGVVTFEMTMAGAVFGTLLMLLREGKLIGRRSRTPVPELPDEGIILQVACTDREADVRTVLERTGAVGIDAVEAVGD